MGGSFSKTLPWDQTVGPPGDPSYDRMGWVPPGYTMKMNDVGALDEAARLPPPESWGPTLYPGVPTSCQPPEPLKQPALIERALGVFGTGQINAARYHVGHVVKMGDVFQTISENDAPVDHATMTWTADPTVCRPGTYPNKCSMTSMRDNVSALFTDYSGQQFSPWDRYYQSVGEAYQAFVDPGFETLKLVNEEDLSDYDPCDNPSLFENLFPLAAAVASLVAFRYYTTVASSLLSSQLMALGSLAIPSTVFFFSRASIRAFGEDSADYRMAVRCSLYPLVYLGAQSVGGSLANSSLAYQYNLTQSQLTWVIAGLLALPTEKIVPTVANILRAANVGRFLFSAFAFLMRLLSRFICLLQGGLQEACFAHHGTTLEFPTNRRWDVPSVAGMLTQEVCEREGWERSDPRAEFVFRGLLTGPAMMEAGTPASRPTIFATTTLDPLGPIYGGSREQKISHCSDSGYNTYGFDNVIGWDGGTSGWLDVANSNVFACQNWDVLRNALQRNKPALAEADLVKGNFDNWVGTLEDFGGELVRKADDPNMIFAQWSIPGWQEVENPLGTSWQTLVAYTVAAQTFAQRLQYSEEGLQAVDIDQATAFWFEANKKAYQYLAAASENGTTPSMSAFAVFVAGLNMPVNCDTNDLTLPEFMWAVTALPSGNELPRELGDFWNQPMPSWMLQALTVCEPPPGLPHGHFTPQLQPITGPEKLQPGTTTACGDLIRNLQTDENSVTNLVDVIADFWNYLQLGGNVPCQTCSLDENAIVYILWLFGQAVQQQQGVGYFLWVLEKQNKWSQHAQAAAVQYIYNDAFQQSDMQGAVTQFFTVTNYDNHDYANEVSEYLDWPGSKAFWDDSIKPQQWCAGWQ